MQSPKELASRVIERVNASIESGIPSDYALIHIEQAKKELHDLYYLIWKNSMESGRVGKK